MIAIATTAEALDRVLDHLRTLGLGVHDIAQPSSLRRIVLADGSAATAEALRTDGLMAVSRPDGGAALTAWERDTAPVTIAGRVSLSLAWSEHDRRDRPGLVELGHGGFGSGHHPTTRMLVEVLADRLRGGERVLDVGCGSGVLALAAVELGAAAAHGVDRKPEAVEATIANAALNGRRDTVTASADAPADLVGKFSVVVANIARDGIAAVAPGLVARLARGGWVAASGITPGQVDQVVDLLAPLREVERRVDGNWAVVVVALP